VILDPRILSFRSSANANQSSDQTIDQSTKSMYRPYYRQNYGPDSILDARLISKPNSRLIYRLQTTNMKMVNTKHQLPKILCTSPYVTCGHLHPMFHPNYLLFAHCRPHVWRGGGGLVCWIMQTTNGNRYLGENCDMVAVIGKSVCILFTHLHHS
jgi:hypothetical protein